MWPTDGTWGGRWQRWQFRDKKYFMQEIKVAMICEDFNGHPAVVKMQPIPRSNGRFRFDRMTFKTIVRQMVQGLVGGDEDEWTTK